MHTLNQTLQILFISSSLAVCDAHAVPPSSIGSGIEGSIQSVIRHNQLTDLTFIANATGLRMRLVSDASGDIRGILATIPPFTYASGFSYSIRTTNESQSDVRLGLYFRQCPDEAQLRQGGDLSIEHLQSGDGTSAITRFFPVQSDSISFTLIYHRLDGLCEGIFSQQVTHPVKIENDAAPAARISAATFSRSLTSALATGDLRMHREIAARMNIELEEVAIRQDGRTHRVQQLLLDRVEPGIDTELFSYVIRDSGWQPVHTLEQSPEVLANKRVDIHIPLDTQSLCPTLGDVERALAASSVRWQRTALSRNVWRWEYRGDNLVSITATRHGRCLEAFDLTQITDLAHSLPETALFNLPTGKTPSLSTEDRSLLQKIVYRLQNDGQSSLDFIAQLPSTAGMEDFERMDEWLGVLRQAFSQQGVPEDAMEFHLYPPAAAGTPPRVFLMVLRGLEKCVQTEGTPAPESALPSSTTCR